MNNKYNLVMVFLLSIFLMSCSSEVGDKKASLNLGGEGQACKEGDICNDGLECNVETKLCVKIVNSLDSTCDSNDDCESGFECKDETCMAIVTVSNECDPTCSEDKYCETGECKSRCPDGMVFIKGGEFQMGQEDIAEPVHKVTLSDFCMDKYEFTNGDKKIWKEKFETGDVEVVKNFDWPDSSDANVYGLKFDRDKQPLITVDWSDALYICLGQGKRLPTEAEWEYAARAGNSDCDYGTDDCSLTSNNTCSNYELSDRKTTTCDSGQYKPNAFGLYDMSGNVWEWVRDFYQPYGSAEQTNPVVDTGVNRIVRGGSWFSAKENLLLTSYRNEKNFAIANEYIGFRCVAPPKS